MQIEILYEEGKRAPGIFVPLDPERTTIEPGKYYEFRFGSRIPLVPPLDWLVAQIKKIILERFRGLRVTWIRIERYEVRYQVYLPPGTRILAPWLAIAIILAILAVLVFLFYKLFGVIKRVIPHYVWYLLGIAFAAFGLAYLIRAIKKPKT